MPKRDNMATTQRQTVCPFEALWQLNAQCQNGNWKYNILFLTKLDVEQVFDLRPIGLIYA